MTRRFVTLGALSLSLALSAVADEETPDAAREFLAAWARDLAGVRTLHVRFAQTKTLRILRRPRMSRGEVFVAEGRMRMVVTDLAGEVEIELAVAEGEARILYPRLARLEIYPATAQSASRAPFPIFGGDVEALARFHRVRLEQESGDEVLVLSPREPDSPVRETRMRFRDRKLLEVGQVDSRGDSVAIAIEAFDVNPDLPEGALLLVVPPGTVVFRAPGAGGEEEK